MTAFQPSTAAGHAWLDHAARCPGCGDAASLHDAGCDEGKQLAAAYRESLSLPAGRDWSAEAVEGWGPVKPALAVERIGQQSGASVPYRRLHWLPSYRDQGHIVVMAACGVMTMRFRATLVRHNANCPDCDAADG